jgi:D-3-phosphoglycerate dehydrogenase / 2-oxoglutarate reductase
MPHILVAGKIHDAGLAVLRAATGHTYKMVEQVSVEAYAPLMPDADALVVRTQAVTNAIVQTAPRLKIVSRHGVGYDAVDVAALTQRNIPLSIVGDVNSRAVAEHALMLMLGAARRIVAHDAAVRSGNWAERNAFNSIELDGKVLLIVGFGRIGRRVAHLALAFDMDIIVFDPHVPADDVVRAGCRNVETLAAGLAAADFVTLHVPGTGRPLIDAASFAIMKRGAILINAARGDLIDGVALESALQSGQLRHAALDVFPLEPPSSGDGLLKSSNVTLTPHNAALTDECAARMAVKAVQNVLDFFEGKLDPRLIVNPDVLLKSQ